MAFLGMDYLNANPDVFQAYEKQVNAGVPTTAQGFAEQHYNTFGKGEIESGQRNPWGGITATTTGTSQNIFQPDLYSKSYSGMGSGYQKELMDTLLPQLKASFQNYGANIDKSTKAAQEGFTSMNKKAMTSGLQDILNNLASRGMIGGKGDSSVASDAIAKGMADITSKNSDKYFQAAMQNAILKAEEPTLLAKIASLGNYSESSDPLEPYKLMAQYDWAMS